MSAQSNDTLTTQFYDYGDRRSWGFATQGDGSKDEPFTEVDLARIERAKSMGWHVEKQSARRFLLVPNLDSCEQNWMWVGMNEAHAWSKLPCGFDECDAP